ncbi:MAG: GGDEF domain-containing protein [Pseudomonas stutzeri]|uniref:biofilm regulation diguanylate cyclase SiaD n=1 Tax=Stutzerimonas stutzeri TaxID=316 RepID=UPI002108F70F|nr:biofilm regulation diguanylate cyclase SiaD [Stutzerimonas stutzeri]MBF6623083.1 GGDEF domain-containing protein [Stutzerimonas stutzeri]MCQ4242445.1 biofilm regulation diguanylate cyclase SiaD [Stutzerimonas stutzeri]
MRGTTPLEQQVSTLLADTRHEGHPLKEALSQLWGAHHDLLERIERIARVSDGYQSLARERELCMSARFEKQLRQLEKVARISDRYQTMMQDLNISLREASTHDALTGIANRRLLTERLRDEVDRARRYERPLSIAMLDIDRFKVINDAHGHEVGDHVLVEVARVMEAEIREQDLCGRWGGEEFLILMPETMIDTAERVMQRLGASIASLVVRIDDQQLNVTVSMGIAQLQGEESYSSAINRADAALMCAKRAGRDRCERAEQ